ncbi:unnamed protein product, partial [Effrenium voratum]
VVLLLFYTGTIFIYRLTFFRLNVAGEVEMTSAFWNYLDTMVDIMFWADLLIQFFFTYTNEPPGLNAAAHRVDFLILAPLAGMEALFFIERIERGGLRFNSP